MAWTVMLLAALAGAADSKIALNWELSVDGRRIGSREVSVKYVQEDVSPRRIVESWTEVDGAVGPIRLVYRQRMTAHATKEEPASFHAVMEQNGVPMEVQARWSPSAWWLTTNSGGRVRTTELPVDRIDLSTADLMDPDTRVPLGRLTQARILSAETGEVMVGPVVDLGAKELDVGGVRVQAQGYAWDAPMGRSTFWFSAEGYLLQYDMALLGVQVQARLTHAPPPGVDDFAVGYRKPEIEELPL